MMMRPHAVCVPFPAQGHINAMLTLAKLIHSQGFHITFVNTELSQRRMMKSRGLSSMNDLQGFRFETIPDGLPLDNTDDATRDNEALCTSTQTTCSAPFRDLISRLNHLSSSSSPTPPVTCIVSDGCTSFTLDASSELGIPNVFFWSTSACGFMGFLHNKQLVERGIVPLKDESDFTNGYLDTIIDWIPGMKPLKLRELPSLLQTTDVLFNFAMKEAQSAHRATAIILNTFHDLEGPVIDAMSTILPPIYPVGPLTLLSRANPLSAIRANIWEEDRDCLKWLDEREAGSVVYVNFGSLAVVTRQQLVEFAFGLAGSGYDFLWVIRDNLVVGDAAVLPDEFLTETKGRCLMAGWCHQEAVLEHPAVGGFLTHCGWNSVTESLCAGVPMVCWPFFGDQQTNCSYLCGEWGIGMEVGREVRREEVERLVRMMMGGVEMRRRAAEWKERAEMAAGPGGASLVNLERVIKDELLGGRDVSQN